MKRNTILTMKRFCTLALALTLGGGLAGAQPAEGKQAKVYAVADAHLDTQWNWDIQTTIKEYVWNTLSRNLYLLNRYPQYIFNFEGGVKYSWMKEYYPAQYEQLKAFVRAGRWHISGSSWDATDALVPSTESAIRNILLGQTFYRQEFGVESTDIFLPDCFGFGWTLPTIAAHCGLIGFSSQKLDWRHRPFHGDSKHPFTIGLWKGVDGSAVMLAHGYDYGKRWNNIDLSQDKELAELATRTPLNTVYRYYGTGDVGGSPTQGSVESVVKGMKGNGPLQVISATSDRLFKDYQPFSAHPELPIYSGELLMDVHGTGCYTSQAAMKLYNRQNELLGDAAERAAVAAEWLGTADYPGSSLTESWRRFIFHQFHDDLTGTSIPRAYEFSWNDELLSLKQFGDILTSSVNALSSRLDTRVKGTPVVFYNPLGFAATDVVEVSVPATRLPQEATVSDDQGRKVRSQVLGYSDGRAHLLVEATVPAAGYAVYDVRLSGRGKEASQAVAGTSVENSVYKITLDANGDITSLFDKANSRELVADGQPIRLALFTTNKSYAWPAWEVLKETIDATPISISGNVRATLVEDGALRKTLCVEKQHGQSTFRQYIRLYEGALARRIDFYNEVDWRETGALLKAEFPLSVANEKALYDLGIGSVERGNNTPTAYEVYAQYWADLTDRSGSYGVSILNDCKYGWDKPNDNTLRLTLLHTPETRNGYAYQNRQDWGYHTFTYSLLPHAGSLDKAALCEDAELLNQRVKAFVAPKHRGELGKSFSLASSSNPNVLIKALKKAEASDEYVVRVYETGGREAQQAELTFASDLVSAVEADGTEKEIGPARFSGRRLQVELQPNGIRTYKIRVASKPLSAVHTESLPLQYDKRCFSWNGFTHEADFESGYSYAGELLPEVLTVDGIPFNLATGEELNGMTCQGDTLRIPAGKGYNRLYLLAAAATADKDLAATFRLGKDSCILAVPSYTGFIGQWGHEGHTDGYLKTAQVAHVGTHRHSSQGDHPYEFTYMFKLAIPLTPKTTEVVLPADRGIVLFAATLAAEPLQSVVPAAPLFRTGNAPVASGQPVPEASKTNLLKTAKLTACTGFVNDRERPENLTDGDETTKWCDVSRLPNYVEFDLGAEKAVSGWKLVGAAQESSDYITATCFLQGKNCADEEWRTLDCVTGNKRNVLNRRLGKTERVRFLRLLVAQPVQTPDGQATRIYELEVYE